MKSHSCLLYNELIKQSFLVYIFFFFFFKELILSGYWQPHSSLGVGPITPSPIENCSLGHYGGSLGCLNHGGLWLPVYQKEMTGPSRQSQYPVLGSLHARKCGLPPNVVPALPIQASAEPFLGLPYMSPSSSPHVMLYILKTNHFVLWIRTVVTKS